MAAASSNQARSSSASHYSKNFDTVDAGSAEQSFLGVYLDNDISDAPMWQWLALGVVMLVLLLKPRIARRDAAIVFWAVLGGGCFVLLKEVTWIPILTTMVYTRTSYPYLVVLPHTLAANASYRAAHGDHVSRLQALLCGFFLYGFGGSIVSDVLMGLPATALGHPRILPCHLIGWALIWYSPMDWIWKSYTDPSSVVHYAVVVGEAVDAVTTPMGRIARGARELRNKGTPPIVGGLLAGIGGAGLRWMAGEPGANMASVTTGFYKTMGYSLLFWGMVVYRCDNNTSHGWGSSIREEDLDAHHCQAYSGSDVFRVTVVSAHVIWTLLCDVGLASGHPFVWIGQRLFFGEHALLGVHVASLIRLGPPLPPVSSSNSTTTTNNNNNKPLGMDGDHIVMDTTKEEQNHVKKE